jgi:hypothetical protein
MTCEVLLLALGRPFTGRVYERDAHLTDPAQIRHWWEERRLLYNIVVGCVGLVTCALMILCGFVSEPIVGEAIGIPDPPILVPLGIIAYGIAANVCYTGGWVVESRLAKRGTLDASDFGVRAFKYGMIFSVGLTLFPAVFSWAGFLLSLASGRRASGSQ